MNGSQKLCSDQSYSPCRKFAAAQTGRKVRAGLWVGRAGPLPGRWLRGCAKKRSPTGHTSIRSTVARWFLHSERKRVVKDFFKYGFIWFSLYGSASVFTYVYSRYALCLLLQILLVAALDIKTRDVPTVSSINSLLSQYCKASFIFPSNFYVRGGANCSFCSGCRMGHGWPCAQHTSWFDALGRGAGRYR
jgi:hypothetical protein